MFLFCFSQQIFHQSSVRLCSHWTWRSPSTTGRGRCWRSRTTPLVCSSTTSKRLLSPRPITSASPPPRLCWTTNRYRHYTAVHPQRGTDLCPSLSNLNLLYARSISPTASWTASRRVFSWRCGRLASTPAGRTGAMCSPAPATQPWLTQTRESFPRTPWWSSSTLRSMWMVGVNLFVSFKSLISFIWSPFELWD